MCNKQPFHNKLHIFNKFPVCNIHSDSHSGGILIEFAFSVPILVILLLFACDHYRYYELQNKLKASAYLLASMIQQLSNTRTDKQLTRQDLSRAVYASCLNLFHNNTVFNPYPLGIYYRVTFDYVKRESKNSYKHYNCTVDTGGGGHSFGDENSMWNSSLLCYNNTQNQIESINTDLVCNEDGEERLLIKCTYTKIGGFTKSKLGFFLIEPAGKTNRVPMAVYQLVITPKPGLFPPVW